jgi:hypothetical protein
MGDQLFVVEDKLLPTGWFFFKKSAFLVVKM